MEEGFCWNGIGERNPEDAGARKHKMIKVGGLFAQDVGWGDIRILDVVVTQNHAHWQVWRFGEPFDIDSFLSRKVFYHNVEDAEYFPHSTGYPHTLTSDYVSRINVIQLLAAVNERWNWHTGDDAITKVIVPRRDLNREAFHLLERFDGGAFIIERDWEEIQNPPKKLAKKE